MENEGSLVPSNIPTEVKDIAVAIANGQVKNAKMEWRSAFPQFVPVAKFRLSVLASGSNISVKPTRILRSAYLTR